jgi:hypothetical protein
MKKQSLRYISTIVTTVSPAGYGLFPKAREISAISQLHDYVRAYNFMAQRLLITLGEKPEIWFRIPRWSFLMHSDDANNGTMINPMYQNRLGKPSSAIECSRSGHLKERRRITKKGEQPQFSRERLKLLTDGNQNAGAYRLCSAIAESLYREARRRVGTGCRNVKTAQLVALRTATVLITAEQELGRHNKVVRLVPEITAWLSTVTDVADLGSLQVKRIESLIALERFGKAKRDLKALRLMVLPPLVQLSLQILTVRLRQVQVKGSELPLSRFGPLTSNSLLKQMFIQLIRSAAILAAKADTFKTQTGHTDFAEGKLWGQDRTNIGSEIQRFLHRKRNRTGKRVKSWVSQCNTP